MSLAQGNNTLTRPRIEPGYSDPESNALTTRPVRSPNRLRNIPFSIGYDLTKEIKEARKRLWEEVKRIKRTSQDVKFQILYLA